MKKSTPQPLVVGEPRFEDEHMVLPVGDTEVKVPRALALFLADRGRLEVAFAESRRPDAEFDGIDVVPTYAKLARLLRQGLSLERSARLLDMDPALARRFYGFAQQAAIQNPLARQTLDALEAEDMIPAQVVDETGMVVRQAKRHVLASDVAQAYRVGKSDADIACSWHVDIDDLRGWLSRNQALLEALK